MTDQRDVNLAWLIWSGSHAGWWLPEERGYTSLIDMAGRYSGPGAMAICARMNSDPRMQKTVAMIAPESVDTIIARLGEIVSSMREEPKS